MDTLNPSMVVLARESRGLKQVPLAKALGKSQAFLSQVENGEKNAPKGFVEKLSEVLDYPPSFFYEDFNAHNLPLPFYRKRKRINRSDINKIRARVNVKRLQIKHLLKSAELPELRVPHVHMDEYQGSIQRLAKELRIQWDLPAGPIANVTRTLELLGILIVKFDFGTTQVDALSIYEADEDIPPIIFINMRFPWDRLRYTMIHELAHIVLHHHNPNYTLNTDCEKEADQFAAAFLLPTEDIKPYLNHLSLEKLANLKRYWKVAIRTLIRRAKDSGKITERKAQMLYAQLTKYGVTHHGNAHHEPVSIPPEEPTLFNQIVSIHLKDLQYTPASLSKVVRLSASEFRSEYLGQEYGTLRLVQKTA